MLYIFFHLSLFIPFGKRYPTREFDLVLFLDVRQIFHRVFFGVRRILHRPFSPASAKSLIALFTCVCKIPHRPFTGVCKIFHRPFIGVCKIFHRVFRHYLQRAFYFRAIAPIILRIRRFLQNVNAAAKMLSKYLLSARRTVRTAAHLLYSLHHQLQVHKKDKTRRLNTVRLPDLYCSGALKN